MQICAKYEPTMRFHIGICCQPSYALDSQAIFISIGMHDCYC